MPSGARSVRRQARKPLARTIVEDGWTLRRILGLDILTARIFDPVPWVVHGFSTRKGGASRVHGVAALNQGFADWDSRDAVIQNRSAFAHAIAASKSAANRGAKQFA